MVSAELSAQDHVILRQVEPALATGLRLRQWWDETQGEELQRFELVRTIGKPDRGFSFFGAAPLDQSTLPVMGDLQNLFYDRPKTPGSVAVSAHWMNEQIRELVLRYLLRILQSRRPQAFADESRAVPRLLRPISWCPEPRKTFQGFGYRQLYFKMQGSGEVGKFIGPEQWRIIDLRRLLDTYEWVVVLIRIFDFDLDFHPLGHNFPGIDIPLREHQYAVLSRGFLTDRQHPEPGALGEFGLGYALLPRPIPERSVLAYGPGNFQAGFQQFNFRVLESGIVRVFLRFMVNRPQRLVNLSIDPLDWAFELAARFPNTRAHRTVESWRRAFDRLPGRGLTVSPIFSSLALLNLLTRGQAAERLCISKQQLEKDMLIKHFQQTFDTIEATLFVWRQVPNWLDRQALPAWIRAGTS